MGCDIHAMIETRDKYGFWNNAGDPDIGRDYELFSVLAGVRNDMGIVPISEPRGIPNDACGPMKAWHESWGHDAHSASWLTLAEMKTYDHSQVIDDQHLILSRDENGKVTSTCAYTNGEHMGPVGKRKVFELWGTKHWDRIMKCMEQRNQQTGDDTAVRLVFFFDN